MPLVDQVSHANARPSLIQQIQFIQLLKYSKKKSQFVVLARFSISGKNESTFLKSGHDPPVSTQTQILVAISTKRNYKSAQAMFQMPTPTPFASFAPFAPFVPFA